MSGRSCQPHPRQVFAAVTAWSLLCAAMALCPAGCVQSEYFGDPHPPTHHTRIYESLEAVDQPYETIGRLVSVEQLASRQAMIDAMQRAAAQRGADAMVLLSIERFAWSDQAGPIDAIDPKVDPVGAAIESKRRWRGEAMLIRWLVDEPEAALPSPTP